MFVTFMSLEPRKNENPPPRKGESVQISEIPENAEHAIKIIVFFLFLFARIVFFPHRRPYSQERAVKKNTEIGDSPTTNRSGLQSARPSRPPQAQGARRLRPSSRWLVGLPKEAQNMFMPPQDSQL